MTGGDPNKAEIELEISGDAVEQAKRLADQLERGADEQERLQKEAVKTNRVLSGLASQRVREQDREQRETARAQRQAERERQSQQRDAERQQRQQESLSRRQRQQESRDAVVAQRREARFENLDPERVAARRIARIERERSIKSRLAEQGYGGEASIEQEAQRRFAKDQRQRAIMDRVREMNGDGEVTTRPLQGAGGELANAFGVATTRAAAIAAVAHLAKGALAVSADLASNPYLSRDAATIQGYRQYVPLIGDMTMDAGNMAFGYSERMKQQTLQSDERSARQRLEVEAYRTRLNTAIESQTATDVARDAARVNPLAALPGGARGTVSEKQRYDEATRLYAVEQKITQARRDQFGVARKLVNTEEAIGAERERLAMLQESRASLQRSKTALESSDLSAAQKAMRGGDIAQQMVRNAQKIEESESAIFGYTQQRNQLNFQNQDSLGRIREAEAGRTAVRLESLQRREQVAGSQAYNAAMAGPEGLIRAQYAGEFVKNYGLANAPADIRSTFAQFFPETARAKGEAEGSQLVGSLRSIFPEEYRDDVGTIRKEVDRMKEDQQQEGEKIAQAMKDGIASAFDGVGAVLAKILEQMGDTAWYKDQAEKSSRSFSQGR